MSYTYEIFLKHAQTDKTAWREFIRSVGQYFNGPASWKLCILCTQNVIHYYLIASHPIPCSLNLLDFLLRPCESFSLPAATRRPPYYNSWSTNFITAFQDLQKHQYRLDAAVVSLHTASTLACGRITLHFSRGQHHYRRQLTLFSPQTFLSLDFTKSKSFLFKKFPKYLKLEKVTKLLSPTADSALLAIDPFPYLDTIQYLRHDRFDFFKHSLVIGSSGSGKSCFLASFIAKIAQQDPAKYRIVVIDPHDSLYLDCLQIPSQSVVHFCDLTSSIDLFRCQSEDINAGVELMLTLFRSLLHDSYNGRLERVLRYATYLLIAADSFSFITLRKLLLDLEYRNQIVQKHESLVPVSVTHFFLTDFNELRSQNYNDAIAPIVAFIDEMQMVPVFNQAAPLPNLAQKVQDNFLNIFSLNRLKLGQKVVQTIAGLLMQQLFLLAEQRLEQHLIIVIDEVAVVENPIIARFLSELRKYHASVILAGQYFDQISPDLQAAIFANVSNFYLFRVSQRDATIITQNLKIKVEGSDNPEDSEKLLTDLKQRECLVRISAGEELMPIFKARTTDIASPPAPSPPAPPPSPSVPSLSTSPSPEPPSLAPSPPPPPPHVSTTPIQPGADFIIPPAAQPFATFQIDDIRPDEILQSYSTSRKKSKEESK